jgi:CO/xanthine dehydrogenase Mo-binding subunit
MLRLAHLVCFCLSVDLAITPAHGQVNLLGMAQDLTSSSVASVATTAVTSAVVKAAGELAQQDPPKVDVRIILSDQDVYRIADLGVETFNRAQRAPGGQFR